MRFSVIIPAFKAELFITETLMSVLGQDYPAAEYEVIVVDDCSPDNQNEKVLALMASHPNLRLLKHDTNKRQGGARNTAISAANGDWVIFLDADDCWLYDDVLSSFARIIDEVSDPDIIRVNSYKSIPQTFKRDGQERGSFSVNFEVLKPGFEILADNRFDYIIWNSCYRKKLLTDNGIMFRENVSFEDSDWSTVVNFHSRKTVLVDGCFYGYRQTYVSTTRAASLKTFQDNVASVFALEEFIGTKNLSKEQRVGCRSRIKKSILSFVKISRYYSPFDSLMALKPLRGSALMKTKNYEWASWREKGLFLALKYAPALTIVGVKGLSRLKKMLK